MITYKMASIPADGIGPEVIAEGVKVLNAVAALDGGDAGLGDTVAVIDTSRDPEWRLTARIVKRVRTFGEGVVARVTIGTVEPVDYAQVSALAADVAALQDDVVGIDGNLSVATSTTYVTETVTTAIDDLDELSEVDF